MTLACVDIGSTFTKAALVDPATGALLATAQAPTTLDDVVTGVLEATAGVAGVPVVACSSAGGGLRLAVVGYEELISAEAGHRAALSAGGRGVGPRAGPLAQAGPARPAGWTTRHWRRCAGWPRTSSCSWAAPMAASPASCGTTRGCSPGRTGPS